MKVSSRISRMKPIALAGMLGAVAVVYCAQAALAGVFRLPIRTDRLPLAGGIGLLAGGLLFGLAMSRPDQETRRRTPFEGFRVPCSWLGGTAVTGYLACVGLYLIGGESPLVLAMWGLAPICLLGACCWPRGLPRHGPQTPAATMLLLMLILLAAAALRLWHLDTLPTFLVPDTAETGIDVRMLLEGRSRNLVGFDPYWQRLPRTFLVPEAVSMLVFGDTLFGLYMSSVVMGMVSLAGTYFLGAELYDRRVGWTATALLAVSYTHIHFSRVPPMIDPAAWTTFGLYYLVRSNRTGGSWDAVAAGLLTGVACQSYFPGNMSVVLAVLVAGYLVVKRQLRVQQWVMMGCGFLMAMGPMLPFLLAHWDHYLVRSREVSVFNPSAMAHLRVKYGGVTAGRVIIENIQRAFLTFFYYHNAFSWRDLGRPLFDPFTAPLLALGFGYAVMRPARMANWLMASGFAVTVLLTALTSDPPSWQRMVTAMPLAAILAAIAVDRMTRLLPMSEALGTVILLIGVTILGWNNWTYFVRHESLRTSPLSLAARYAATLPRDRFLVVVRPPWKAEFAEFRFLAPQVHKTTVLVQDAAAGRWPSLSGRAVVVFAPEHKSLLPVLQATWRGGVVREFTLPGGALAFYAYEAP